MLADRMNRREALKLGVGAAALGLLGSSSAYGAKPAPSPSRALPGSAADEVVSSQFLSTAQLEAWGAEVDALGLRATGSPVHERYVRLLASRLRQAGLKDVALEGVAIDRWLASDYSLTVDGQKLSTVYYQPYSQVTPASGLTAPLVYVGPADDAAAFVAANDVRGKIAVFDVGYLKIALSTFAAISFKGAYHQAPGDPRQQSTPYARPWLNAIRDTISLLTQAGAVATVGIWTDLPGKWGRQYTPYDGTPTAIPGLWIDKLGGAALKDKAANGASATVVLQATTAKVRTHNVVGFIPGRSPELTVLHSHTDGTNGMEENGQLPIIATAQYLARLPLKKRERTIMVMLSSGHFHGGAGIRGWIDQHARDLLPRVTSIQTIEHVGCTEWLPDAGGEITATGHPEIGAWFAVPSAGLVAPLEAQVRRDGLTGTVARPYVAHPEAPGQRTGWPGEGTYFWLYGGLRDGNFITGPYGLITADLDTTGMVDYAHMRRSAMSSVTTTLQLAATSNRELKEAAA